MGTLRQHDADAQDSDIINVLFLLNDSGLAQVPQTPHIDSTFEEHLRSVPKSYVN